MTIIHRMEVTKSLWIVLIFTAFLDVVHGDCYQSEMSMQNSRISDDNAYVISNNEYICSTWGNGYFYTFDGYFYNGKGNCTYIFTKHCHLPDEDFEILVKRNTIGPKPFIERVFMKLFYVIVETNQTGIYINGKHVDVPYRSSNLDVYNQGDSIVFTIGGIIVNWNLIDNLQVQLPEKYRNQTCGLCGDYNGFPYFNEGFREDDQASVNYFLEKNVADIPGENCLHSSVPTSPSCNVTNDICKNILQSPELADCAERYDLSPYLEICERDSCACNSSEAYSVFCICSTLAEFSKQCANAFGKPENWRNPGLCEITCPPTMQYKECGSACEKTCTNQEPGACSTKCVSGCFCPNGTVFDDVGDQGCIPSSECYCKYAGNIYSSGDTLDHQCENCTCFEGLWKCDSKPCSGSCAIEGGSHFTTFDQRLYTFHGRCSYILTQLCTDSSFAVYGQVMLCDANEYETCLSKIMLAVKSPKADVEIMSNGGVTLNKEPIPLPYDNGNVIIFKPTSFYIIVNTNIGVRLEIQLVPLMQVYIYLESSYFGLTCGLCGNFNDKQVDDFIMPNGMSVQDLETFTYSWRNDQTCPKAPTDVIDPCSINIQKESYASLWCSKLISEDDIFAVCHPFVNPTAFYQKCMYDTCLCKNSEDCMCAALSSYVRACFESGVIIKDWTKDMCYKYRKDCHIPMVYHDLVNTCPPTCKSLSINDRSCAVEFTPIDGCICMDGLYLTEQEHCVLPSKCPCYHMGVYYNPGDIVNRNGIECICRSGKLECDYSSLQNTNCTLPMVYLNCSMEPEGTTGIECLKSCLSLNVDCYSSDCVSGCICPQNMLADGKGGCVSADKCTCFYDDKIFDHNAKVKIGCNNCTCNNRKWVCDDQGPLAECLVYGEGNYITFDQKHYRYSGQCEYTLVQDFCANSMTNGTFRIISENTECSDTGETCSKTIKVYINDFTLLLTDGEAIITNQGEGVESPFQVQDNSLYLVIQIINGLVLIWDKKTGLTIKIPSAFQHNVCGLCGNYDGNSNNDFNTRGQCTVEDVIEFGNSWKLFPSCPETEIMVEPCEINPHRKPWAQRQCNIILSDSFKSCHSEVDPTCYYDACVKDSCACDEGGDCDCYCTAIAMYVKACLSHCICVEWRTPNRCPVFCDYYNQESECRWHYKSCGENCLKTCRNPSGTCSTGPVKVEGCYPACPSDKPFYEEVTMKCVAQCGCYDQMGHYYKLGEKIESCNNCEICNCTTNGIKCEYNVNACYCEYNGVIYGYNQTIDITDEGNGFCLVRVCGVNGTTSVYRITCGTTTTRATHTSTVTITSKKSTTFTPPPTTKCVCYFNNNTYAADSVIYNNYQNNTNCGYRVICDKFCQIKQEPLPCTTSTTMTPYKSTSTSTTQSSTTSTKSSTSSSAATTKLSSTSLTTKPSTTSSSLTSRSTAPSTTLTSTSTTVTPTKSTSTSTTPPSTTTKITTSSTSSATTTKPSTTSVSTKPTATSTASSTATSTSVKTSASTVTSKSTTPSTTLTSTSTTVTPTKSTSTSTTPPSTTTKITTSSTSSATTTKPSTTSVSTKSTATSTASSTATSTSVKTSASTETSKSTTPSTTLTSTSTTVTSTKSTSTSTTTPPSTTTKITTSSTSSATTTKPSTTSVTTKSTATSTASSTATSTSAKTSASTVTSKSTTPSTTLTSTSTTVTPTKSTSTSTTTPPSTTTKITTSSTSSATTTKPSTTSVSTKPTATSTASSTATSTSVKTSASTETSKSTTPSTTLTSTSTTVTPTKSTSTSTTTPPSTTTKLTTSSTSSATTTKPSTTSVSTKPTATSTASSTASSTSVKTSASTETSKSTTPSTTLTSTSTTVTPTKSTSTSTTTPPSTTTKITTSSTSSATTTKPSTTSVSTKPTATSTASSTASSTSVKTSASTETSKSTTPSTTLTSTSTTVTPTKSTSTSTTTPPSTTTKLTTSSTSSATTTKPSTTSVSTKPTATSTASSTASSTSVKTSASTETSKSTTPSTTLTSTSTTVTPTKSTSTSTTTPPSTTTKLTTSSTSSATTTKPSTTSVSTTSTATSTASSTATSTSVKTSASTETSKSTTPSTTLTSTSTTVTPTKSTSTSTTTPPSTTTKLTTSSTSSATTTKPSTTSVSTTSTATSTASSTATSTSVKTSASTETSKSTTPSTTLTSTSTTVTPTKSTSTSTTTPPSTTTKLTTSSTSSATTTKPSTTSVSTTSTATSTASSTATSTSVKTSASTETSKSTTPSTTLTSTSTTVTPTKSTSTSTTTPPSTTTKLTTSSTSSATTTKPSTTSVSTTSTATSTASSTATSTSVKTSASTETSKSTTPSTTLTSTSTTVTPTKSTSTSTTTPPSTTTTTKITTSSTSSATTTKPSTTSVSTTSTATSTASSTATSTSVKTSASTETSKSTTPSTTLTSTSTTVTPTKSTSTSTTTPPSTTTKITTSSTSSATTTKPSTTSVSTTSTATSTASSTATSTSVKTSASTETSKSTTPSTTLTSTSTTVTPTKSTSTTTTPSTTTSRGNLTTTGLIESDTRTAIITAVTSPPPCEQVMCPAGAMFNLSLLDCKNVPIPTDCNVTKPVYDTKLCCFIHICPYCQFDGIQYQPGESWRVGCEECMCTDSAEITCQPTSCTAPESITCILPGYQVMKIADPANPCCLINQCLCNTSLCTEPISSCHGLEPVFSVNGCCVNITCVLVSTTVKTPPITTSMAPYTGPQGICMVDGNTYTPGSLVPSPPGSCLQCICTSMTNSLSGLNTVDCAPIACNKTCEQGETYEDIPGRCCGKCVQTSCIVTTPDGQIKELVIEESWTPNNKNCTIYKCTKQANLQLLIVVTQITCEHNSIQDCSDGEEYMQPSTGQCCGKCVKTHCVITLADGNVTLLLEGESISSPTDKCTSYTCVKSMGGLVTVTEKVTCQYNSAKDCQSGEEYVPPTDQCCGKCVKKSCVVITPTGNTELLNEGQSVSYPNDKCTTYTCVKILGQLVTVTEKVICLYNSAKDCQAGEEYEPPTDQCCGKCVKKTCVVITPTGNIELLNEGQSVSYPNDKCTTYTCVKILGQLVTVTEKVTCLYNSAKDCQAGEEYEPPTDQCCGKCVKKTCVVITPTGNTELLNEGQSVSYPNDKCTTYTCVKILGQLVTVTEKVTCQYNSAKDCQAGEDYVPPTDQCCGKCVKKTCVVITPTGNIEILNEGQSVSYPNDKCTTYTCVKILGQLVTVTEKVTCLYNSAKDCQAGEEYEPPTDQCCGKCVKKSCVVITPTGNTELLNEGQSVSYPNDKCTTYTCVKILGQLVTVTEKVTCLYNSAKDCRSGEEYVPPTDQCCGKCVQKYCVVITPTGDTKLLQEGDTMKSDNNCTTYTCVKKNDQLSTLVVKENCTNSRLCGPGETYVVADNECCGKCVQKTCVVSISTDKNITLQPGDTVPNPTDPCTSYSCKKVNEKLITEVQTTLCKYKSAKDCQAGEMYKLPSGQCCGQCIPTACHIITPRGTEIILEEGKTWSSDEDKCISYGCTQANGSFYSVLNNNTCTTVKPEDCQSGLIEVSANGCCSTCKAPKICALAIGPINLGTPNCPLTLNIPYCSGVCKTPTPGSKKDTLKETSPLEKKETKMKTLKETSPLTVERLQQKFCSVNGTAESQTTTMVPLCQCCRSLTSKKQKALVTCKNGTTFSQEYDYIQSCGCRTPMCDDYS